MTVASSVNPQFYDGNGSQTVFIIPWTVRNAAWIEAGWFDAAGVWHQKLNGSEFTVALNGATWQLTFNAAPPAGVKNVAIVRKTPGLQTVNFKDLRRFPAENTETMGDRLAEAIQDLAAALNTVFRLSPTDFGKLAPMDPLSGAVGKFWTIVADPDNPGGYKVSFSPSVAAVEATSAIAAEILVLAGISDEIVAVAEPGAAAAIATIAPSIASVVTAANSITAIGIVSFYISNVNTVATNIASVNALVPQIAKIVIAADGIADITLVADDLALGPAASFILRAPQAALDADAAKVLAQQAAAATAGSAATATTAAATATTKAGEADASSDAALSYAAASALAAATALQTVFLPNFVAKSRTTAAQPASPANLDTYILPASPTGAAWSAWSAGDVMRYFSDGASWVRVVPVAGSSARVLDEDVRVYHTGSAWVIDENLDTLRRFGVIDTTGSAGGTENTTALNAAIATGNPFSLPAGKILTTIASITALAACSTLGPGQIKLADGNFLAPNFTKITGALTEGSHDYIGTAFNGDTTKQFARGHYIDGALSLGQPTTGYKHVFEAVANYTRMHVATAAGHNQSLNSNNGRTGASAHFVRLTQAGNGDAFCYAGSVFVSGTKAGATDVLASPAGVIIAGTVLAGANHVYLNNIEQISQDGGFQASAGTFICRHSRNNSDDTIGGIASHFWFGFRAQTEGSAYSDEAFSAAGKFKYGLALTGMTLDANKACIALPQTGRIYFNATLRATGGIKTTGSPGNTYISDDSTKLHIVYAGTSRLQIASNVTAVVTSNMNVATGTTTRAGLALNSIVNTDGNAVGIVSFAGNDAGSAFQEYATIEGVINSATAETGAIAFRASSGSGTLATVARMQNDGVVLHNAGALPTGGFAGAGILNAHGLRVNNVNVATVGANTFTGAQTLSGVGLNINNVATGIAAYGVNDNFAQHTFSTYSDPTVAGATWHNTFIMLRRARGTQAAPAAVVSGDSLGAYDFFGYGSSGFARSAQITAVTDGTPGANVPARIDFLVSPNGSTAAQTKMTLRADGKLGIGTTGPTALLDVNSDIIRLRTAKTPASAAAAGNAGDIAWDTGFIYVCTATNTWKRAAIATW